MTEQWKPSAEPLVLHVIPTPVARGAQREARALADQLDTPGVRAHRVLCLFDGPSEVRPDFSLHFPPGDAPAVGYDPRLVLKLRSALRGFDPTVVVAHGGDPLKYLVPAMVGHRRPLAYYAIGTYAATRRRRVQLSVWRHLMSRVDVVAAEGDEVKDECTSLMGVPPERVVMTPNGRDPGVFFPTGSESGRGPLTITFVGALTEGKGPDRFVEVVAALRERDLDFRSRIIGDGPLRGSLIGPAGAAGVDLLGSRADVPDLLRESDIMVFPSRPEGEGMPGVLIEAGLSGVPVVATDVPGVRTIIADGETGLVVPHGDLEAMVAAVHRLAVENALRSTMGRAARLRCVEHFSLDAVAEKWLRLLSPLLGMARTDQA
jgi:glycosyltransferase involved in cell wall biosynthesis